MGIFDSKLASCQPLVCASCMLVCAHKKPWRKKGKEKHVIRSESEKAAGDNTSLDALMSSTPGIILQMSGFLTSNCFWAATVFVDYSTSYMYTHLQWGQTLIESIEAKASYEKMAETFGIILKKFHTDNGIFAEEGFKSKMSNNNQTIGYCGVGAHFKTEQPRLLLFIFILFILFRSLWLDSLLIIGWYYSIPEQRLYDH